jgi:hypothetical protein
MINPSDRHQIGQARLLRRQGRTYEEIRAVLGPISDDRLRQWLKGIPRPPGTNFNRTSIKRHAPKTLRQNTGADYRGCLIVDVLKSAGLYRRVEGWWRGLTMGAVNLDGKASIVGSNPHACERLG